MSDELRAWLSQQLKSNHWSQRELSRQSSISQTLISQTLSGDVSPSADFCIKVALVFGESPEKLLKLAGILPPARAAESSDDSLIQEILDLVRSLNTTDKQQLIDYARFLRQRQN